MKGIKNQIQSIIMSCLNPWFVHTLDTVSSPLPFISRKIQSSQKCGETQHGSLEIWNGFHITRDWERGGWRRMRQKSVKLWRTWRGFGHFISQCKSNQSKLNFVGGRFRPRQEEVVLHVGVISLWNSWKRLSGDCSMDKSHQSKEILSSESTEGYKGAWGSADVLILFFLFSSPVLTGYVGDRVWGEQDLWCDPAHPFLPLCPVLCCELRELCVPSLLNVGHPSPVKPLLWNLVSWARATNR